MLFFSLKILQVNTFDVLLKSHMYESAHKGPQGLGSRRPVISYIEKSHACFIYAAKVCYEILNNFDRVMQPCIITGLFTIIK